MKSLKEMFSEHPFMFVLLVIFAGEGLAAIAGAVFK